MASWDEDQEDGIIEYVRVHPCFYDTRSADDKNRDLRSAEWEKLAGLYSVTVKQMKAKWKALNDSFNRCLKEKLSARSGDGAEIKVKWVHFEKMQFLAPFRTARETQTTLVAAEKEPEEVDMDLTADKEEEPEQKGGEDTQKRMAPPLSTRVAKKKKVSKVSESPSVDEAFKARLASITQQLNKPTSDTQLFTDHICAQLEKLSARRQLRAKNAIQQAVSQALDEQLAEEEASRSQPTTSQAWGTQILPPTQQSQFSETSYYPAHPSLLGPATRPHSNSSAFSNAGYMSSASGSSSESNTVLYNGLNNASQFDA